MTSKLGCWVGRGPLNSFHASLLFCSRILPSSLDSLTTSPFLLFSPLTNDLPYRSYQLQVHLDVSIFEEASRPSGIIACIASALHWETRAFSGLVASGLLRPASPQHPRVQYLGILPQCTATEPRARAVQVGGDPQTTLMSANKAGPQARSRIRKDEDEK